jgi:mannonate dehydratase
MARLNIPLLSHAGGEVAPASHVTQDVNNPLRLRRALDHGVRVKSFDLFTRMMGTL